MPTNADPYFNADGTQPEPPPVYTSEMRGIMARYQQEMAQQVDATVADFQYQWRPVQAALNLRIQQLETQMLAAEQAGQPLTAAWLQEAQRLAALQAAVQGDVQQFAEQVRQGVGAAQQSAAQLGMTTAQQTLAASVPPGMSYTFGVPPASVLHQLAGAIQPESPLYALFEGYGYDAAERATQALMTSVALGEGAKVAAQRLRWATDMNAQRAEVIARTEIMRTWRGAQLANYRANSDVVQQWMWSCDFSPRSCSACIAMDGTYHSLDEELDDHICGRCSALPITRPWSEILGEAGVSSEGIEETSLSARRGPTAADWLAKQPAEVQNQIMGPAKAEAYRQGALQLRDLVGVQQDPQWGASIVERSMRDMGLDAQGWLAEARANANGSSVATEEQLAAAQEGTPAEMAAKASTTRPLNPDTSAALSESPVWPQIADTLNNAPEAGAPIDVQPFSVEPQSFRALRAEQKQLNKLLVTNDAENIGESKARIAQELATRLQDNPAFAALPQRLVDDYISELRAQGYAQQDIDYIAEQFGKPPTLEEATSLLVHSWASGKGTLFPAIQQAVEQEFGLANTYSQFSDEVLAASQTAWGDAEARAGLQAFVREMYNNTQDYLAAQGITEVTLYRGMVFTEPPDALNFAALDGAHGGAPQTLTMALQPASSFTSEPQTAALFGNMSVMGGSFNVVTGEVEGLGQYRLVAAARVPATDILGTAMSGFGARGEAEFVVLGGQYDLRAVGMYADDPMNAATIFTPTDVMNLMTTVPRTTKTGLDWARIRALEEGQ